MTCFFFFFSIILVSLNKNAVYGKYGAFMQNKKGFTLLELLVVVLIIGILAAIALPQYQMAVAKSKFAKVRSNTQVLVDSVKRYLLANDTFTDKLSDLDITIEGIDRYNTGQSVWLDNNEVSYGISPSSDFTYVMGAVYIKKVRLQLRYCIYKKNSSGREVTVDTLNTNHLASKLASKETNNNNPRVYSDYMTYGYK